VVVLQRRDLSVEQDPVGLIHIIISRPLHVLLEPLKHRLRTALELQVAVPASSRAPDPLNPLVADRHVVEHRLHILGRRQHVIAHLVQEGRNADGLRPFPWGRVRLIRSSCAI
jgi:hypothetical protein